MTKTYCDKCKRQVRDGEKWIRICLDLAKENHFCQTCFKKLMAWVNGED